MGLLTWFAFFPNQPPLADAAATALGNRVMKRADLEHAAHWAEQIGGILGGVVIVKDAMATWGDIELVEV